MKFMCSLSLRQVLNGRSRQAVGCSRVGDATAKNCSSWLPTENLMAVDVKLGKGTFEAGVPKMLFQTQHYRIFGTKKYL